jgi:hypothetical protein
VKEKEKDMALYIEIQGIKIIKKNETRRKEHAV